MSRDKSFDLVQDSTREGIEEKPLLKKAPKEHGIFAGDRRSFAESCGTEDAKLIPCTVKKRDPS